jgi:hypothetical protein
MSLAFKVLSFSLTLIRKSNRLRLLTGESYVQNLPGPGESASLLPNALTPIADG